MQIRTKSRIDKYSVTSLIDHLYNNPIKLILYVCKPLKNQLMTLLAIVLLFLLFPYQSHSAPTERFFVPECPVPVEEDDTSNPRRLTHYSEEELKLRGLEFNPYAKSDFLNFLKANAEYTRSRFDKTGSLKKGSTYDRVPVDAIIAYREELKRNDELLKGGEPLDLYPEDYSFRTCVLY